MIPPSVLITRRRLRESGMRENRTYRLSGGRRPAPAGRASSDPTPRKPGNAGGGKGHQVEATAKGSRLTGVADGLVVCHVTIFGHGHGLQRAIIDESQHRNPNV